MKHNHESGKFHLNIKDVKNKFSVGSAIIALGLMSLFNPIIASAQHPTCGSGCYSQYAEKLGYPDGCFPFHFPHSNQKDWCENGIWIPVSSAPAYQYPTRQPTSYLQPQYQSPEPCDYWNYDQKKQKAIWIECPPNAVVTAITNVIGDIKTFVNDQINNQEERMNQHEGKCNFILNQKETYLRSEENKTSRWAKAVAFLYYEVPYKLCK